ncbi:uncharacterized protein LOC123900167 [Trifolium pratense]|uniref:uncharacterized protein LOC123900167 n=1 Tax=Trifolium pratense TaxID=57577 RepID=UPI001E693024|nr:uncharacterized protein LOC123900167 [Trifolium pratense]
MFDILFGWSKASKCKKAIKRARYKIRLLKNKRQAIVKQLRKDLAELIQNGYEEAALDRVEQLMKDERLAAAYELLDQFCEFILTQISYIRKHKDCPNDIKEAISSLIFASARCGDIPELFVVRKLFGKRYGEKFATTAVELFPGNLVNKQLTENLSGKYVTEDLKYRMVDEIARDNNCLQQNVLAIEYYPDWQQLQLKENKGYRLVENDAQINAAISESKVHPSDIEEIERDVKCVHPSIFKSSFADSSAIVSLVQKYPQYIMSYPMQKKVEKVVEVDIPKLLSSVNSSLQNKDEKLALISSAEMVDYVDEIEDCRFSLPKDGACKDEMLLKFNSSCLSRREKTQVGCDRSHIDQDEPPSETLSTRSSRNNKRAPRKRSRRRSTSIENLGIVDIGYMTYYQKPCKSPSTHKYVSAHGSRKDKKKPMLHIFSEKEKSVQSRETKDSNQQGLFLAEEASLPQHSEQKFKPRLKEVSKFTVQPCLEQNYLISKEFVGCSLDQPCYFCIYDDKDYLETQFMNPKRVIEATHDECCHCRPFFEVANGNIETKEEIIATYNVSNPRTNGSLTRIETEIPYLRALTMPQERHRKGKDKMLRTFSCPYQHPNHVHPKLPDYDDIAAKFTALKRENLQNKDCSRK